jgi:hypothetical protein
MTTGEGEWPAIRAYAHDRLRQVNDQAPYLDRSSIHTAMCTDAGQNARFLLARRFSACAVKFRGAAVIASRRVYSGIHATLNTESSGQFHKLWDTTER